MNPLSATSSPTDDRLLVERTLAGDTAALDTLVRRHQPFIYNVAWKFVHDPDDAWDLTQEVLLKVITKLSQYRAESAFRTWLYRIVFTEFLQSKRRSTETQFTTFADYGERLEAVPNPELTVEEEIEQRELSREMQIKCMSGMLMCLNREQRLIYILGAGFGIDHKLGAEVLGLSPGNFRVKLHRARRDLETYTNDKCGLVNPANACRCPKKAKALREMGALDEDNLRFNLGHRRRIADYVADHYAEAGAAFADKVTALYRDHPTREDFPKETIVAEVIGNRALMKYFE